MKTDGSLSQRIKTFYMPVSMSEYVQEMANTKKIAASDVMRDAINSFLNGDCNVKAVMNFNAMPSGERKGTTYYISKEISSALDKKAKAVDMSASQLVRKIIGYMQKVNE